MRIRLLREADLPLVRAWMQDAPEAPAWSDDDLAGIVEAPSADQRRVRRGWVAEEESGAAMAGFVVAAALCIPNESAECELEFVFVAPAARERGVGCLLVETVFGWARDLGADEIRLEVRASNAGASRLYQRCGFTIAGHRPGYYAHPTEDAVLMHRRIRDSHADAPV
jgi:[ribosomal protein S18]-alanine N-acetyltransferase